MRPIKHNGSNFVYRGPSDDIGDLWVHRDGRGGVFAVYEFTDRERELIAAGAHIEFGIYQEPMPPISARVTNVDLTTGEGEITKLDDQAFRVSDEDVRKLRRTRVGVAYGQDPDRPAG